MEDCQAGKLDIFITKSVQRFGRNTEETLVAMRSLLAVGVILYFQIEGYSSDAPDAELQTSLRTALAAADNASSREDRKWGVQKRVEDGTSEMYKRPCYGYKKTDDGVLIMDQERAEVVKHIYRLYPEGTMHPPPALRIVAGRSFCVSLPTSSYPVYPGRDKTPQSVFSIPYS